MTNPAEPKLRFQTLALRRQLASDHHELAPVVDPAVMSYGPEDRTTMELSLALSELPDEARPTTVARLLLPEGVRLETIEVQVGRPALPGRLGRLHPIAITVALVPEPKADGQVAGHWVFLPVLQHACFVDRKEDLAKRIAAELAVLPAALALDLDGWRRMLTPGPRSSRSRSSSPPPRSRWPRVARRWPRRSGGGRRSRRSMARAAGSRHPIRPRRSSGARSPSAS